MPERAEKARLRRARSFRRHFRSAAIRVLGIAQPVGRGFAAHPKRLFPELICCVGKMPDDWERFFFPSRFLFGKTRPSHPSQPPPFPKNPLNDRKKLPSPNRFPNRFSFCKTGAPPFQLPAAVPSYLQHLNKYAPPSNDKEYFRICKRDQGNYY